jgi:CheY-like chemotaxis protein
MPHHTSTDVHPQLALIADPTQDGRDVYRRVLTPRRYIIEQADSGADALAKAVCDPPDLVVVHADPTVIDGYSVCELLRQDRATKNVPILMISEEPPSEADLARARSVGAAGMLWSGTLADNLWPEIQRVVGQTPAAQRPDRMPAAVPAALPQRLWCPRCDASLVLTASHVGGVKRHPEQWDDYVCPTGCRCFEYRHRTRRLRPAPGDRGRSSPAQDRRVR